MKLLKKIDKFAQRGFRVPGTKFKLQVWMLASILLIFLIFPTQMLSTTTIWASSYEGPAQEFVAVRFNNQRGYTGNRPVTINGLYSQGTQSQYASKWNWWDPESVTIDIDGEKRGCPELHLETSGYAAITSTGELTENPIKKVEYTLYHNGKEYQVINWLYFFRGYVTISARGDEDFSGIHVDEIDWSIAANVYIKIGINKWIKTDPTDEMFAGILKIDVRDIRGDTDIQSHTEAYPFSAPAQLSLRSDIDGSQYGELNFDNFYGSWLNPDGIPDKGYYKIDVTDFSTGKKIVENKIVQPWMKWEVWCHVLVSRRFTLPQTHQGQDQDPWVNEEISWLDAIRNLINDILLGVNIWDELERLLILAIIGVAIIVGLLIVLTAIFKMGGRKR